MKKYVYQLIKLSLFFFFLIVSTATYAGAVFTWKGTSSNWNDINNWDENGDDNDDLPDADDTVIIPSGYTTPILPADMTIFRLSMEGSSLNLNGHTLTITTKSYSDIENSTIIFGTTGQILTATGAPDYDVPYGTFLCTNVNLNDNVTMSGGLQFHSCTFNGTTHTLSHIGDSHYNGGNIFTGDVTLINDESVNNGHWFWGDVASDVFNDNLVVQSLSRNRKEIRLADNSTGNIFHKTVDIRTYTGGSVKIAHNSAGDAVFEGVVNISNETVDPNGERVSYIGFDGDVVFQDDLNINFTTIGADKAEISIAGGSGDVTFLGDVNIDNDKADAARIVRFGNTDEFVSASAQVHLTNGNIVLQDFNDGVLYFQYFEKTSGTAQNFSALTENTKLISKFSDWNGSFTADAGIIHLRENVFQGTTDLINYGSLPIVESQTTHRYSGGNTFKGATTLSLGTSTAQDADYDWVFGYYEPDTFESTLTANVYTSGPRTLHLSKNSEGNSYVGDVTLNSNENGEIVLGDEADQTSFISGTVAINMNGSKYQHFASRGHTKFDKDITVNIASGAPYMQIAENGGTLDFAGATANFTVNDLTTDPTTQEIDILKISGGGTLTLKSDVIITQELDLELGFIDVENKILDVGNSTISGGNDDSFIIAENTGYLQIKAENNTDRDFPMGSSAGNFMRLRMNHLQGGTVDFKVNAPTGGATDGLSNYWHVEHDNYGKFDADVTLYWETGGDGTHHLMVGDDPSWGAFTVAGTIKNSTNTVTGQTNSFFGDFDVASSASPYAGAAQTISACAVLEMSAIGTGDWTITHGSANTALDIPNAQFNISGLADGTYTFTWTADLGGATTVDITVSQSGGGGSPYQVWTGATDNNWFNCANWEGFTDDTFMTAGDNAVPDVNTYAFVTGNANTVGTTIVTGGADIECKFLSVDSGSRIDLEGADLTVTNELLFLSAEISGANSQIIAKGKMQILETIFQNDVVIDYQDDGSAPSHSFNGLNTFNSNVEIIQNSTETNVYFGADHAYMNGGGDTYNGNVQLTNNQDTELIISHSSSGNVINGDLTINNMSNGWTRVGYPDYAHLTETTLDNGKVIDITGSTGGKVMFLRMLQATGGGAHALNTGGTVDIYIHSSQMRGDLDIYGDNVEVRESEMGTDASSTITIQTNSADTKHNGGNTFYGNTTLNHTGSSPWHWGYTGGDKFMENASIINNTNDPEAYTFIADKSTDNEFYGTTFMTTKASGGIYIADNHLTKVTFKGETHFWGDRTEIYDGGDYRGRDAIQVARKGEAVFEDAMYANFSNVGTTDTYGMYMSFAYDSGSVTLQDVILDDKTDANRRRGFYFGTYNSVKDDTGAFADQVVLNGSITNADPTGFVDGSLFLSNLTQYTEDAINLSIPNGIVTLFNSELKGTTNIEAKAAAYRWNYIEGDATLEVTDPTATADYYNSASYGNFRSGGNNFRGVTSIIYDNTSSTGDVPTYWEWGAGALAASTIGADTFALAATFENQCDKLLIIGNETEGNQFYDDLTIKNTANGQIEIAKTNMPVDEVNVAVKGNVILDNQSATDANRINVAEDGIFAFGGDLTTQSSGGEIYLAYGGTATDGWIYSDAYLPDTTGTNIADTVAIQTLNFETDKTFLHKLQSGSRKLTLASNIDFVTSDTDAHLRFTTGQVSVNNFDMNLHSGQLTAPNSGTAKGDFTESNVLASGTGHFKRYVPLNSATLLPLATPAGYYPATVTATAGDDVIGGRIGSLLSDSYSNANEPNGSLIRNYFTSVSWVLTKDDNATNTDFSLDVQWNATNDELPDFDRTTANINRYNKFVTSTWACSGEANQASTNNGDGTYSLSNTYSGLGRLGVFAPTSPYVNAGNDITVSSCQFGALNAHIYPGTDGIGQWVFEEHMNGSDTPTAVDEYSSTTEITGVSEGGEYAFKWLVKKPIADNDGTTGFCTVNEDFVTITTNNVGGGTVSTGTVTYWKGTTTDWFDCSNWTHGIPGNNTEVFISADGGLTTVFPQLTTDITLSELTIFGDGELDLNGFEIAIKDNASFNTATINGDGTLKMLPKVFSASEIFDITNTDFAGDVILESDRFEIGLTTFDKSAEIAKIGEEEDQWYGGNEFNSVSITLSANADLYLATQEGNLFTNDMEINIETSSGEIYFTTAFVTTTFKGHIYIKSTKKASDFDFGDGTIAFEGGRHYQEIYNELNDYNLITENLILNKSNNSRTVRLRNNEMHILGHLKLQKGRLRIGYDWNNSAILRLKNSDPDALILERGGVGDPEPYQASIDYSSYKAVFSRMVDFSTTDEYHYPMLYRPISITPDGNGAGAVGNIEEMNLQTYWWLNPNYRDNNTWYGSGNDTDAEYIRSTWVLTQTDEEASGSVKVKLFWRDNEERVNVDRTAMFPISYNYDTDEWDCIGFAGDADQVANGDGGSPIYFVTSTIVVSDFSTASTNFGIFGIGSAKANAQATDAFQTVRECLAIQLDATRYLQSPIGGEWNFVSASSNMEFTTGVPMLTADVVFSSVTDPETYVSVPAFTPNTSDTYQMVFRWVRKCLDDCGTPAGCGDGSELNEDFITVSIKKDANLVKSTTLTWTGAADHDWMNCANWSDGIPDDTTEEIIIPGVKNYAQMPSSTHTNYSSFIPMITTLQVIDGGSLDLNGNNIDVQYLTFDNAFTTGFYTGAILHEFDKSYSGVDINDTDYDFMTGNFITVTRTFQVRKSTFYNNIGFVIRGLDIHSNGNPGSVVSYNGGNTFKENSIIDFDSEYRMIWGWNDWNFLRNNDTRYDYGGPDVFEKNVRIRTQVDCNSTPCPTLIVPWRRLYTVDETDHPTDFDTDIDWFAPKYYDSVKNQLIFYQESNCCGNEVCNSADTVVNGNGVTLCDEYDSPAERAGSNRGQGYEDYARFDDRFTQSGNPDLDKVAGNLNQEATAANKVDEATNVEAMADAQKNVEDSYGFVTVAWEELEWAETRSDDILTFTDGFKAGFLTSNSSFDCDISETATSSEITNYRNGVQRVEDAIADLQNTLDNGGCGTTENGLHTNMSIADLIDELGDATAETLIGVEKSAYTHDDNVPADYMNSPGDDNAKAIVGNIRANQGNACAKELHDKIRELYNSLTNVRRWYNALLSAGNSNNLLYLAYNTQGNEFQDSTQFYIETCARMRIADTENARAEFTGNGKKHDFVNRSIRGDALLIAVNKGTSVEFKGGDSWTNAMVHSLGSSYYGYNGQVRWTDSDTLNISNTGIREYEPDGTVLEINRARDANGNYNAGRTYIGGRNRYANIGESSRADLDGQLIIGIDSLTAGYVYLVNFNQNSQKHEVDVQIDHKGRLEIWGKTNFSSRVNIVNRGVDYAYRNAGGANGGWGNRSAVLVGWYNEESDISFNGLLTLQHDIGQQKYYDFETTESGIAGVPRANDWWRVRDTSTVDTENITYIGGVSSSGFYFHRYGTLRYNGGVLIENQIREIHRRRVTRFGDFGYPGHGEVSDAKGFRIGTEGFRSGYLEVTRLYKYGEGEQLFLMSPDIILPSGEVFIHPDFGVPQKTSLRNAVLRIEDCTFDGDVHIEAPQLGVRSNEFNLLDGDTKIVSYGGDGGYISGGNTFHSAATFELRSMRDLAGHSSIRGRWILGNGIPDIYHGDITANNYSVGGIMGLASYNNPEFVTVDEVSQFEGTVTIHNKSYETSGGTRNITMSWYSEDIPGLPSNRAYYTWVNRKYIRYPRFLIGGYADAKAEFEKEVTIINESKMYDIEIAGYDGNEMHFKKGITVSNIYPEDYTPTAGCLDYGGDVVFGQEDATTHLMIGGFTTVDEGIEIENFEDGTLEMNGVAVTSASANSLLSFDMADQLPGDAGKGRLHLGFCSINQKLEARSRWLRSNTSLYGQDVNFTRVDGNCDAPIEWRAGNVYEGDFKLLDESTVADADIVIGSYGTVDSENLGDIYKGFATFESDTEAGSNIIVSDKFVAQFEDNITLLFNTVTPLNNVTNLNTTTYTDASTVETYGWFAGIRVTGATAQQLSSTHPVILNRLKVFQANGSSTFDIDQEMTIQVEALFDKGKVVLGKKDVNVENSKDGNSVAVLNPNDGHFVANSQGTVNRRVFAINGPGGDGLATTDGSSVLFPVGNLTNYLPATLTLRPNVGIEDMYRVRLIDDVYTTYDGRWDTGTNGGNASFDPSDDSDYAPSGSPTSIDRNFVRRSWVITEDVLGGTDGTLMLQWYEGDENVATDEPPGFDRTKTTIVHYQADKDEWRCMEELSAAQTSSDGLVRKRTFQLSTDADDANETTKMGVFSIGSLTAGDDNEISTCGAGAAQLTASPLSPPLTGAWDFVTVYHDETGELIPPDVYADDFAGPFMTVEEDELHVQYPADFNTAMVYTDVADPNGVVYNLEANKVYMFKWQPEGLDGDCASDFATILVRTGSFTSAIVDKTLVWQGNDQYFWDCTNWAVQGEGTNYALPNATMDLVVPMVTAIGLSTEPWYPEYYDKVLNLEVKSIRVEGDASFTVGGLDITSQENAQNSVELTVSQFITVEENAEFINRYRLVVEDSIHNEGDFRNVPYFITTPNGYTTPELVVYDAFANRGANSNFEAGTNSNVTLYGDLINEGAIFHTAGFLFFQSASSFITGGSDIYLRQVDVNKQNITDFVSIVKTNVFITAGDPNTNKLIFNRGKIATYSAYQGGIYSPSLLAFMSGAIETNSNADRYVVGPVSKYFDSNNEDFIFPIGKSRWARAGVTEFRNGADFVTAEHFDNPFQYTDNENVAFISTPNTAFNNAHPLEHVSWIEHWMIDESNSAQVAEARVSLYWEDGNQSDVGTDIANMFNAGDPYNSQMVVAHFMDADKDGYDTDDYWVNEGGVDVGGSTLASGALMSHGTHFISSFSPFTFGTKVPDIVGLPVTWKYVKAKLITDGKEALVEWGTSAELNNDYFEVLRSKDGKNFTVIGIVEASNLGQGSEYAFIDENPNVGVNYYQVRQVDYDGSSSLSRIVSVNRDASTLKNQMVVYPNPTSSSNVNLLIYSAEKTEVHFRMFNAIGHEIHSKTIYLEAGQNDIDLSPNRYLAKGVYVISADELFLKSKFVVE